MSAKTIIAEDRPATGTGSTRRLRKTNRIPAVLYGSGSSRNLAIDAHSFEVNFKHISENEIITLKLGKETIDVLIKDYQHDILKNRTTHIDFYRVERNTELRTHVPVKIVGSAKGVRDGGILEHPTREIEVSCLPGDLPEFFEVDVTELEAGHAIHISDLKAPKGVKILTNAEQVVASVGHAKASAEEATAAAPAADASAGTEASK